MMDPVQPVNKNNMKKINEFGVSSLELPEFIRDTPFSSY